MAAKSIVPATVNPDLQKERNAASFRVEEFATWWNGGADKLKFKREVEHLVFEDMKENSNWIYYKSHQEIYDISVEYAINVAKKLRQFQAERNPGGNDIWPKLFTSTLIAGSVPGGNPFGIQFSMVVNALRMQGTDEQFEKFGKRLANFEICGAYAQTELGHGTFLRGLQTRADFDRDSDEFVLNTPAITAYKWWPGGLGHSSNYCLVVAQLFVDDQPKGVQMFVVPVRDEETHVPLPGVDIGDIGKKIGFEGVNNGYLGLKDVRVPRDNMLMRNAQVLRNGTFVSSPVSVLTYFSMVYMRCVIAHINSLMLCQGATIATRYSAVRRQSPINPNEPEPQIMDHVTQQLKLFPEIANGIAHRMAADHLATTYEQTVAEIERGAYVRLPELHALSCVMKVLCASDSSSGIERLRLACGGHGYLISSNMGPLYATAVAACTYEGENTVLLLQVGRFLMKAWRSAIDDQTLAPTVQYLAAAAKGQHFGEWSGSWENIVRAIQYAAANKTRLAFESLTQRLKSGQTEGEAANNTGIELIQAAELHGRSFLCATFLQEVSGRSRKLRSAALNVVLENMLELNLVQTILRHMSDILRFVNLTDDELSELQARLECVLKKIRPDAVAICDGFDFHDCSLKSDLGAYDGNVYERLFDSAKKSPLNEQSVPKSFHQHLKPFMKSNM